MSIPLTPPGRRTSQIVNIENDVDGNPLYVGWAAPGSTDSDASWLIIQIGYSGGYVVSVRFAEGEAEYRHVWDDRASLSYS